MFAVSSHTFLFHFFATFLLYYVLGILMLSPVKQLLVSLGTIPSVINPITLSNVHGFSRDSLVLILKMGMRMHDLFLHTGLENYDCFLDTGLLE